MARLFDCFRHLISLGIELEASLAAGQVAFTPEDFQQLALAMLDEARAAARAAGQPAERVESASFAMVAWIDEVVARHPGWARGAVPLQVQLFNSTNAPSEFFHHLSALQPEDDEVREVYWHALLFGFKGQYYFEDGERGELAKLKALHAGHLPVRPLALETLAEEHVTPQPYAVPDPPGPRSPELRERALLRTGGAFALLAPLLVLLWSMLKEPPPTAPTLTQRVEQRLQTYACADLATQVDAGGDARVRGYVSLPEDMARVERDVRETPGVGRASFDLQLRVWPHCEVLAILKPYQARNRDRRHGLRIAAESAREGRLREGDAVAFSVTNADYDGFLRVDYYTADGSVLHLDGERTSHRLRPREQVDLGRDLPASWLVSPPFGTVLITVLSSPVPMGGGSLRPPFELASAYLGELRGSLAANELAGSPIADLVFLQTVAR